MKAAVANHGAKLIVVDPRRVEMVDWAALWLPEKPGTDVPLFSAMAHIIIKERLYNQDFIDRRTEGFADFARSMESHAQYAEAISGVDRNLIVQAAACMRERKRGDLLGTGHSEHSYGTDNAMSPIHLALLTAHRREERGSIRCAGKTTCKARRIPAPCHGIIPVISASMTKRPRANSSRRGISSRAGSTADWG
jgi:anaerobic selenocysteine-containing dehydrogenase